MPRLPPYGFVTSDSIVDQMFKCRSRVPMIECYHMYSIRTNAAGSPYTKWTSLNQSTAAMPYSRISCRKA